MVRLMEPGRPGRCPARQHDLDWVLDDIAICIGGHEGCVWVYTRHNKEGSLNADWSLSARKLADAIRGRERLDAMRFVPDVITSRKQVHVSIRRSPEERRAMMIDWRTRTGRTQQQASDILGVSRGLLSDLESGRRAVTEETWANIIDVALGEGWDEALEFQPIGHPAWLPGEAPEAVPAR